MKRFILACSFLVSSLMSAQNSFEVTNSVQVKNEGCQLTKLSLLLPVPEDNPYQSVSRLSEGDAEKLVASNTGNTYIRKVWYNNLPSVGSTLTFGEAFDVTLFPMQIDLDQIDQIYPYDKNSDLYQCYTRSDGEFINTANSTIVRISDQLWKEAAEEIIPYARLAYEYVASHYRYLNPNTGLHPLNKLLSDGGGDCGNLTTIYVNLLRAKGIPSRHVTTVRPDGSYHIWADFYLQNWGWIPVDVNMKLDYPDGDYFGWCRGDGIVMSLDINHQVEFEAGQTYTLALLQNFAWWYWYSSSLSQNPISIKHIVTSKEVTPKRTFTIGKLESRQVAVHWTANTYACGYHLSVRRFGSDDVIESVDLGPDVLTYTFENLTPQTSYLLTCEPQRKTDNLLTTLGEYEVIVTTPESPAANEAVEACSSVCAVPGGIELNLRQASDIAVYTTEGRLAYKEITSAGIHTIHLNAGIYILVSTDSTGKISRSKISVR